MVMRGVESLLSYIGILRLFGNVLVLKIIYFLGVNGRVSNRELRDFVGGSRSSFYSVLDKLRFYRLIEKKGKYVSLSSRGLTLYSFLIHLIDSLDNVDKDYLIIDKSTLLRLVEYASRGYYFMYLNGLVSSSDYREVASLIMDIRRVLK